MKPSKKLDELFATIDAWIDDRPGKTLTALVVPQRFVTDVKNRHPSVQVRGITVHDRKGTMLSAVFCETSIEHVERR
jgi:hypothetical protein